MEIKSYLEKYQKPIYQTFINALNNNKIAHAYLLSGAPGMPLLETARFLAKSLLCDSPSPLACSHCVTCERINNQNYPDLIIVDGKKARIKKSDINNIEDSFSKTALENKGIMVYILNLVETTTNIALNSLLKFLEEPNENVYAFLTTENQSMLLPTIISRTQVLNFLPVPREDIILDALNSNASKEDAELLSSLYNDGQSLYEFSNTDLYKNTKELLMNYLEELVESKDGSLYYAEKTLASSIKGYEQSRLFLDMLEQIFISMVEVEMNDSSTLESYDNILKELLKKLSHIDRSLLMIVNARNRLNVNVNIPLMIDYIASEIIKE